MKLYGTSLDGLDPARLKSRAEQAQEAYRFLELERRCGPLDFDAAMAAQARAARFGAARTLEEALDAVATDTPSAARLDLLPERADVLLIGCGSIGVLKLIARAAAQGWRVVAEECEFAHDYLAGIARGSRGELVPLRRLPRDFLHQRERRQSARTLYVTFPDRPLPAQEGGELLATPLGQFHVPDIDGMIARLPFARVVFADGQVLGTPGEPAESAPAIATAAFSAACTEIAREASAYLAWRMLLTHSPWYVERLRKNGRAVARSYLRYAAAAFPDLAAPLSRAAHRMEALKVS